MRCGDCAPQRTCSWSRSWVSGWRTSIIVSCGCTGQNPQGLYITYGHREAKTGAERKVGGVQKRHGLYQGTLKDLPSMLALPGCILIVKVAWFSNEYRSGTWHDHSVNMYGLSTWCVPATLPSTLQEHSCPTITRWLPIVPTLQMKEARPREAASVTEPTL